MSNNILSSATAAAFAAKFNSKLNRDEFSFIARGSSVILVDEDGEETPIRNPFVALMEWESANDEDRYYGLPSIVLQ